MIRITESFIEKYKIKKTLFQVKRALRLNKELRLKLNVHIDLTQNQAIFYVKDELFINDFIEYFNK